MSGSNSKLYGPTNCSHTQATDCVEWRLQDKHSHSNSVGKPLGSLMRLYGIHRVLERTVRVISHSPRHTRHVNIFT